MGRYWKKVEADLLSSPEETMGFSRELSSLKQSFTIKKYDFSSLEQVEEIKKELLGKRILILNAKDILKNIDITKLKRGIEDLNLVKRESNGWTLTIEGGKICDDYLNKHLEKYEL